MQERGIDVAVVWGVVKGNSSMFYVVNGAKISHAMVIKKRGETPVLFCGTMEREEAGESGLTVVDTSKYDYRKIMEAAGGDKLKAAVMYYKTIFEEYAVSGNVAFYGQAGIGRNWELLKSLDEAMPGVRVSGEFDDDIFITARMTKEPDEIERMKVVGRKTCDTVQHIIDFLKSHRRQGDVLVKDGGAPLTVGDCKARIRLALAERMLIEEVDTIFAIGRDAGIPHSRGNDADPIAIGKTIVFDIFPQEQGGGYFFDMTRTFVVGEASSEIRETYRQLEECFDTVSSQLRAGEKSGIYQTLTCDYFEKHGHETIRTNPQVTNGYVHSLGHGIGLDVHENPRLSDFPGVDDVLAPGSVFTFEPGLYYPDKGYGMRIEDVYVVTESNEIENLTNFPRDLVIEI
jgi:Xaa-Pro aminopeptidase